MSWCSDVPVPPGDGKKFPVEARALVADTNVVVAGLLTGDPDSPTARVLSGMLEAQFAYLVSPALLSEYREVLLRSKIRSRHGLEEGEIDSLLTEIVANAIVRETEPSPEKAPTRQDQYLWDLLATKHGAALITGEQELLRRPPEGASVISPTSFVGWRSARSIRHTMPRAVPDQRCSVARGSAGAEAGRFKTRGGTSTNGHGSNSTGIEGSGR